ncbi:MAG TPA: peptide MFS transporter [Opitutaceae bacterium]|nr:peptide MFS transporter [Opitutaceae bacterium]
MLGRLQNNPIPPTPAPTGDRSFLGHPRGLGYLGFTEAWERFSYYGMQTLLVLYMTRQLLLPGHVERIAGFKWFRGLLEWHGPLSTVALASAIFGLYTGLVYVTPIAGGIIADRWLGRTRTVTIGALLMAAGHFLMAFDVTFLLALLCLLTGVGCFKGNLAIQVGDLYAPNDLRRADAFQIYYLFINVAVIVAPLVTGTLGEKAGWHYGFGAAGVGMVLGLVIYLYGGRWLPPDSPAARAAHRRAATGSTDTDVGEGAKLTADDWKAMILLVALLPVLAVGAVVNQEIFDAYLLWVPDHVSLRFFGWTMPTTWLVSLDAVVSVSFLVLAVVFWRLWTKFAREPEEITKITLGLAISALGGLCLAAAGWIAASGHKAGFGWVLGFEILNSAGFANVFPVGLALYARVAPKSVSGTFVAIYYLHLFLCNSLVGWLGGLVDKMSGVHFWLLHAGLVAASAFIMFLAARFFGRWLTPDKPDGVGAGAAATA